MRSGNEQFRSLSGKQAQLVLGLLESSTRDVTRDEVIGRMRVTPGYANKLLHELSARGWLHRMAHGRYRVVPPEWGPTEIPNSHVQAKALARSPEGYLGLASAASVHGLTTQHRNAVWVLTTLLRRNTTVDDTSIHFVRVKPTDLFGIEQKLVLGERLPVSDVEKTALDCLAYGLGRFEFSELTAIVLAAVRKGQWRIFARYLSQMRNGPVARRMGFLLEAANVEAPSNFVRHLRSFMRSTSPLNLDPTANTHDSYGINRNWQVRINRPVSELFKI